MKRSCDSTHHCSSPTPTLNSCDLNTSTRKQSSEQECCDSTHHCSSPTPTLNSCDLNTSTRKQSSEQEYSYLTARKRHSSIPYSHNTPENHPKLFTRNPAIYFPKVDKSCIDVFGMLPRFLENLLESRNLLCSATAATKSALSTTQL